MPNIVDLTEGVAFILTDLHGEWQAYARYRDQFLTQFHRQQADYLIILGDLIHGYGAAEDDASVPMILDVMNLQSELGAQRVIMLLGNHELPHIYGITLSKGDLMFTPRFEHSMGDARSAIIEFFGTLPFAIRTAGGLLLTHAGPTPGHATRESVDFIDTFDHQTLLGEADRLLDRDDVQQLVGRYLNMTMQEYHDAARYYLAADGPNDERYYALLRGFIASNLQEWPLLWDFFFNQCEIGLSPSFYRRVLAAFLTCYAVPEAVPKVMVTGHLATRGGYALVTDHHLRLASWAHAAPKSSGAFLLVDVARTVKQAEDLIPFVHPIP